MNELKAIWNKPLFLGTVFVGSLLIIIVFIASSIVFIAYSMASHSSRSLCLEAEETRRWHANGSWYQSPDFICEAYIDGNWIEVDPKKDDTSTIYYYNSSPQKPRK